MNYLEYTLLGALILCAIITAISKKLLVTIIVFMAYSLMMSIIWVLLEAPDLAITEAAVGAGITSVLFFLTLRKIPRIQEEGNEDDE